MARSGKVWEIEGFRSTETIFSTTIPYGKLTDREMAALLQWLAARHLSENEICGASLRKRAKGYLRLLEVRTHGTVKSFVMSVGTTNECYYTATIWHDASVAERFAHLGPEARANRT